MTDEPDEIPLEIAGHEDRQDRGDDGVDLDLPGDGETPEGIPTADEDADAEPVEYLVQLAEKGEIDPWDIDIVAVTEEFLDALEDGDLRRSGRALFYASVLLRMKGDDLVTDDEPEDEPPEPWARPPGEGGGPPPDVDPVASLEREMERRLERKKARGTPETLDELVRELREAERDSWWKESRTYDTSDSPRGYDRGTQTLDYHDSDARRMDAEPTEGDVTEKTHQEDIEAVIDEVRGALTEHFEAGRAEVLYAEIEGAGGSRVLTFLALLFLAHRGGVRLRQDELFGDLWIQDPTAAGGSGEVAAD